MQQASYLERGPLLWILPLYLNVNKKKYDDDDKNKIILTDGLIFLSADLGMNAAKYHVPGWGVDILYMDDGSLFCTIK